MGSKKANEVNLLKSFQRLALVQQRALQDYADFLVARYPTSAVNLACPSCIVSPENESVIAALQRYSAMYPMLDKTKMLQQAADLVSQHVVNGRDRKTVIDQIDALFKMHYRVLCDNADETR